MILFVFRVTMDRKENLHNPDLSTLEIMSDLGHLESPLLFVLIRQD